jgi:hypothetical protein
LNNHFADQCSSFLSAFICGYLIFNFFASPCLCDLTIWFTIFSFAARIAVMAKRDNHYEAAFEEFLRQRQIPYVAVDEKKRALLGDASLKSLDFIVSPPLGSSWLVDVKGRHFPTGGQRQYWKNWSTRDDVCSLTAWERLFGPSFCGLLVFAYEVIGDRAPVSPEQLFEFGGRLYGFVGMRLADYAARARRISVAWDTLAMPAQQFRSLAAPVEEYFCRAEPPKSTVEAGFAFSGAW